MSDWSADLSRDCPGHEVIDDKCPCCALLAALDAAEQRALNYREEREAARDAADIERKTLSDIIAAERARVEEYQKTCDVWEQRLEEERARAERAERMHDDLLIKARESWKENTDLRARCERMREEAIEECAKACEEQARQYGEAAERYAETESYGVAHEAEQRRSQSSRLACICRALAQKEDER